MIEIIIGDVFVNIRSLFGRFIIKISAKLIQLLFILWRQGVLFSMPILESEYE